MLNTAPLQRWSLFLWGSHFKEKYSKNTGYWLWAIECFPITCDNRSVLEGTPHEKYYKNGKPTIHRKRIIKNDKTRKI